MAAWPVSMEIREQWNREPASEPERAILHASEAWCRAHGFKFTIVMRLLLLTAARAAAHWERRKIEQERHERIAAK